LVSVNATADSAPQPFKGHVWEYRHDSGVNPPLIGYREVSVEEVAICTRLARISCFNTEGFRNTPKPSPTLRARRLSLLNGQPRRALRLSVQPVTVTPRMRSTPYLLFAGILGGTALGGPPLKIADVPLRTAWAEKVDPANVHPEYPRPQMVRDR